jgi:hypothetical protein
MPLLVPAAWLMAMLLTRRGFELPRWVPARRLPFAVASLFAIAIALYAFALMPHLQKREKVRNIAASLNEALPPNEPLYAVDPDYQPALFYVRDPIVYVRGARDLPPDARYVLVQPANAAEVRDAEELLRLKDYRNKEVILLRVAGTAQD